MNFHPAVMQAVRGRVNEASVAFHAQNRGPNTFVDKVNQDLSIEGLRRNSPADTSLTTTRYTSVAGVAGNVSVTYLFGNTDMSYAYLRVGDLKELRKPGVLVTTVGSDTALGIQEFFAARVVEDIFAVFISPQHLAGIAGATVLASEDLFLGSSSASTTTPPPLLETTVSWLSSMYELVARGQVVGALRVTYRGVEDLFATRNFLLLNDTLTKIDIKRLPLEVLIGLIRSTFRGRLVLPAWVSLLEKIKVEMQQRNVPQWERLLVGLENEGGR
jgi:hypothetical protein